MKIHLFPGWLCSKVEVKDHLSPARAETRAELGKSVYENLRIIEVNNWIFLSLAP